MGSRLTGGTAATDDETRRVRERIIEGNIQGWWRGGKGNGEPRGSFFVPL